MEKPRDETYETDTSPQLDGVEAALIASVRSGHVVAAVGTAALGTQSTESDSGRKSGESEIMADETIEQLAREAAEDAPSERAAQLQYEWRKDNLVRELDRFSRDRQMVAAWRARNVQAGTH